MKNLLLVSLVLTSLTAMATQKVVYGVDNRVDVFESTNNLFVELSKSTAAMISSSSLASPRNGLVKVRGLSLARGMGVCSSESFSNQMSAANCSGFLVGKNLLATAGHCIRSARDCRRYKWVFDYKVASSDQFDISVDENQVYGCQEIIGRSLGNVNGSLDDWALIKLDREVTDRNFLQIREQGDAAVGTELVVIGHPSGLPTKIADGATVTKQAGNFFFADLDTYGGNSGSAVFNATTGVVEGILVRGETDYVSRNGCRVSNVLDQGFEEGEDVSKITRLSQLIIDNR